MKHIKKRTGLLAGALIMNFATASAQCQLLCNTDFENVPPMGNHLITYDSLVPCWSTTASDRMIEIWKNGMSNVPSYSGSYFIELNANMASTLYQDFTATPGTIVNISFAHRGRQGTDVMDVHIGAVGGPYTNLGTYSDANTAWGYYTVSYMIPAGVGNNFSLRFNSVSSSSGSSSVGNFLDAISISIPSGTLSVLSTSVTCFGGTNGTAVALINGGVSPYTYTWSPSLANTSSITGLAAGIYTVSMTEANGCTASRTVEVVQGTAMTASMVSRPVSCAGKSDGIAELSVSGSTAPYTYSWSPSGATTSTLGGLSPGTYTAYVTSAAGCTAAATASIAEGSGFSLAISSQSTSCIGVANGSVNVVPGGAGPYSYTWTPCNIYAPGATGLPAGIYSVSVADLITGCNNSATVAVSSKEALQIASSYEPAHCGEAPDGKALVIVTGNSAPYTYTWVPGGGNGHEASGLSAGTYTVLVGDADHCIYKKEITVTEAMKDELSVPNVFTPNGDGINDEFRLGNTCMEYALIIYNRWGQKVFETQNTMTSYWTGKDESGAGVPNGVYFYTISGQGKSLAGTVSLFR